jgi:hypothetical protein
MHIGMSSVVRANASGRGDLRCIGSLANVIRSTIFTAPNVKTAADLKGGMVGISRHISCGKPTLPGFNFNARSGTRSGCTTRHSRSAARSPSCRYGSITVLGSPAERAAISVGGRSVVTVSVTLT